MKNLKLFHRNVGNTFHPVQLGELHRGDHWSCTIDIWSYEAIELLTYRLKLNTVALESFIHSCYDETISTCALTLRIVRHIVIIFRSFLVINCYDSLENSIRYRIRMVSEENLKLLQDFRINIVRNIWSNSNTNYLESSKCWLI